MFFKQHQEPCSSDTSQLFHSVFYKVELSRVEFHIPNSVDNLWRFSTAAAVLHAARLWGGWQCSTGFPASPTSQCRHRWSGSMRGAEDWPRVLIQIGTAPKVAFAPLKMPYKNKVAPALPRKRDRAANCWEKSIAGCIVVWKIIASLCLRGREACGTSVILLPAHLFWD